MKVNLEPSLRYSASWICKIEDFFSSLHFPQRSISQSNMAQVCQLGMDCSTKPDSLVFSLPSLNPSCAFRFGSESAVGKPDLTLTSSTLASCTFQSGFFRRALLTRDSSPLILIID